MASLPKAVEVGLLRALGFLAQPSKTLGSRSPLQWVHKLELLRLCPEGRTFPSPELGRQSIRLRQLYSSFKFSWNSPCSLDLFGNCYPFFLSYVSLLEWKCLSTQAFLEGLSGNKCFDLAPLQLLLPLPQSPPPGLEIESILFKFYAQISHKTLP